MVNGYSADLDAARTEALSAAEQALVCSSDDPSVLKYAGHAFAICGHHAEGERAPRRALELNLYDEGAHGYLGWALAPSTLQTHQEEIGAVLDRLLSGARKHPGRPFWFLHRSVALTCGGDFEGRALVERCPLDIGRSGSAWEVLIRLISRDPAAAELRTAGLRKLGLVRAAN